MKLPNKKLRFSYFLSLLRLKIINSIIAILFLSILCVFTTFFVVFNVKYVKKLHFIFKIIYFCLIYYKFIFHILYILNCVQFNRYLSLQYLYLLFYIFKSIETLEIHKTLFAKKKKNVFTCK